MKVLVADDSSTMRRIIKNTLGKIGVSDVTEATNGAEAVAGAMDASVKLILMDCNMPEMSGIDAVRAIRTSGNKTPIVMVTTEAEKKRVVEAVQAGINDYMVKPFTPDDLATRVKKFGIDQAVPA